MPIDIKKKKIILIHGLASKPAKDVLHELWVKSLVENISTVNKAVAKKISNIDDLFESAYWADETPHHIPDDTAYIKKLRVQVDKVINERKLIKTKFHVGAGEKISDFFKDRGADVAKLLAGALTVKDDVMKRFLRETELYADDQYIADKMRSKLEIALRNAWDNNYDVALISHSMGTFIAYDVLWRFSHRALKEYKKYKNKRVQLFITMGSPLGEATIRDLLFSRFHVRSGKRQFPTNIDFWHNYSCLGDVVSHQENFENIFFNPMRNYKLFPTSPKYRAIDYAKLHNPFIAVAHKDNKNSEKRNPHKSYGYLVQPRLGSWLCDFLKSNLKY
jgi:hypothetical protein